MLTDCQRSWKSFPGPICRLCSAAGALVMSTARTVPTRHAPGEGQGAIPQNCHPGERSDEPRWHQGGVGRTRVRVHPAHPTPRPPDALMASGLGVTRCGVFLRQDRSKTEGDAFPFDHSQESHSHHVVWYITTASLSKTGRISPCAASLANFSTPAAE